MNILGFNANDLIFQMFETFGYGLFFTFSIGFLKWLVFSYFERGRFH